MHRPRRRSRGNLWFALLKQFVLEDRLTCGRLPDLSTDQILAWADAYHHRMGDWPTCHSGLIPNTQGETWLAVEAALCFGLRGFPFGSTLARFLQEHRGVAVRPPPLTVRQVLRWADRHYRGTGSWPTSDSGPVADAPDENWSAIDTALRVGNRGLPGDSSLARLLAAQRGVPNVAARPQLRVRAILRWADAHRRRTGDWPTKHSGAVPESPGDTWMTINAALEVGNRGLPGGSSLPRLLARHRGRRNIHGLPPLSVGQILAWADQYRRRHGCWPRKTSGPVEDAQGETWAGLDAALLTGGRGLRGGSSLARLMARQRRVRNRAALPRLSVGRILRWADRHHRQTGQWPAYSSGVVLGAPGETWRAIALALHQGHRGLPGGQSLARLLAERRGARKQVCLDRLRIAKILAWADEHYERTGQWPRATSGPIEASPGETWMGVDMALRNGKRGFAGGSSLARLLAGKRRVRNIHDLPPLSVQQVLGWADAHYQRTGCWPKRKTGAVPGAAGETWQGIDWALRAGKRGLKGGLSLVKFLARHRGVRPSLKPALTIDQILCWARAFHERFGTWPTRMSGPVDGAAGSTWFIVDRALRDGLRGLPGGSSLARVLKGHEEKHAARLRVPAKATAQA